MNEQIGGEYDFAIGDLTGLCQIGKIGAIGANLRTIGGVRDAPVLAIGDTEDLVEWFALGVLDNGIIKFLTADKVDCIALVERFVRRSGDRRTDEGDLQLRIRRLPV